MFETTRLFVKGFFYIAKFSLRHQENLRPILRSYKYRNGRIRISVAAILLAEREGKYLLVKNRHRPELFAPIGGVYKHSEPQPELLANIEWQPDYSPNDLEYEDLKNDLRGYLRGGHFPDFLDWFTKRKGREGEQCLYREVREELQEGRVGKTWRDKANEIKLQLLRHVVEGPFRVEDRDYDAQFRYFEVYRPEYADEHTSLVLDEFFGRAGRGDNKLCLVTAKEIRSLRRRSDGQASSSRMPLAPHTRYLLSSKWHGMELPKF